MVAISCSVRMWSVMNSGPVAQFSPIGQQVAMTDGGVERVGRLAGEHRSHRFDGAGNHHRDLEAEFLLQAFDAEQRGLDVAGVVAGFEKQDVRAAFDQRLCLQVVAVPQVLKGNIACDRDRTRSGSH